MRLGQALDKVEERLRPQSPMAAIERIPVIKSGLKVLVPIDQIPLLRQKTLFLHLHRRQSLLVYYFFAKT